jgi:general stress protein 26
MNTDIKDRGAVERRLWNELQDTRIGMLGLVGGSPRHFQPMTAFSEPDTGEIWFFTRDDTDLAVELDGDRSAMFVMQSKDFQACIGGRLAIRQDRARMDKYWNAVVAAWYPQGRDDPRLTMLCLRLADAEVWISQAGPVRFAWEIAKANATHTTPDVGEHTRLDFH